MTAKKFAKSQAIEKYASFLRHMYRAFGYDEQFLKCFIGPDRDATEVHFFLDYLSKWTDLELDSKQDLMH